MQVGCVSPPTTTSTTSATVTPLHPLPNPLQHCRAAGAGKPIDDTGLSGKDAKVEASVGFCSTGGLNESLSHTYTHTCTHTHTACVFFVFFFRTIHFLFSASTPAGPLRWRLCGWEVPSVTTVTLANSQRGRTPKPSSTLTTKASDF